MEDMSAKGRPLRLVRHTAREWDLAHFDSRVADYVAGELSEEENDHFEEVMLANPEWAEIVETEQMLREGIRSLAAAEPQLFSASVPGVRHAAAADMRAPKRHWISALAMAATVTFAALLLNARMQITDLKSALGSAQAPSANVEFLRLDEMRGPGEPQKLVHALPAKPSMIVLEIPAGPAPLAAYRLRLLHAGKIVWDLAPASANDEGFLMVSVPTAALVPGDYSAVLSAPDDSALPIASYAFTLARH